jgi:AcrR family transcriptional regulator
MYLYPMSTQEQILTQSFKLFLLNGYKEVSVNKIIEKCHISKGAFYHHFQSKEHLYMQVLDRFFFNYFNSCDFVYDTAFSFDEKLQQFIISFVTPYEELLELTSRDDLILYFRFLFQAAANHELIKYRVNKHFYKKGYYLAILIKEQQQTLGIPSNFQAKDLAKQLLSIIMGITILDGIYDATKIKARLTESINVYTQLISKAENKLAVVV